MTELQKTKLFKKLEDYVVESFSKQGRYPVSAKHMIRSAYWAYQLDPGARESVLLAALGHDLERAFRLKSPNSNESKKSKDYTKDDYLKKHQEESAKQVSDFLISRGADNLLVKEVARLISAHEVGGDKDQNLVMDADSVSFFENNVDYFINEETVHVSKKDIKRKFDWMFERISSKKAKEITKPWYNEALERLKNA